MNVSDPKDRQALVTMAAAVAAHALLASGRHAWGSSPQPLVDESFAIAEAFVAKTESEAAAKGIKL